MPSSPPTGMAIGEMRVEFFGRGVDIRLRRAREFELPAGLERDSADTLLVDQADRVALARRTASSRCAPAIPLSSASMPPAPS